MSQESGYAVELELDSVIEKGVDKAREFLSKFTRSQLVPSTCITLFSSSFKPPAEVEKAVEAFIKANKSVFQISFSLDNDNNNNNGKLYLMPTPSGLMKLKQLRSQLFELLIYEGLEIGDEEDEAYDSWMPYCVVAKDVHEDMMNEALSVLKEEMDMPVTGQVIRIGLVEFVPNVVSIHMPMNEYWNRIRNLKTMTKEVLSFALEGAKIIDDMGWSFHSSSGMRVRRGSGTGIRVSSA